MPKKRCFFSIYYVWQVKPVDLLHIDPCSQYFIHSYIYLTKIIQDLIFTSYERYTNEDFNQVSSNWDLSNLQVESFELFSRSMKSHFIFLLLHYLALNIRLPKLTPSLCFLFGTSVQIFYTSHNYIALQFV